MSAQEEEHGIIAATAFLSIGASCFVIFSFLCLPKIRNKRTHLVLCLAVADVIQNAGAISFSPLHRRDPWCFMQTLLTQFGEVSKVYWTIAISVTLHAVFNGKQSPSMLRLHLYVWSISAGLTIAPLCMNLYSDAKELYCVISGRTNIQAFEVRVGFFFAHLWAAIIFTGVIQFQLNRTMARIAKSTTDIMDPKSSFYNTVSVAVRYLQWYPLIMALVWLPLSVVRVYGAFRPFPLWALVFAKCWSTIDGIIQAIVFGMSEQVKKQWVAYFALVFYSKSTPTSVPVNGNFGLESHVSVVIGGLEEQGVMSYDASSTVDMEYKTRQPSGAT